MANFASEPPGIMSLKTQLNKPKLGFPATWLFSISLVLFMMQPWAPKINAIPLHVFLIWLLFAWIGLFRGSSLKRLLLIFSPIQQLAIFVLAASIFIRSVLDGWDMMRFAQFTTGVMIALLGALAGQSNRERKILLISLGIGMLASCTVAILQYIDLSPGLWQKTRYAGIGYIYGSSGLESYPVSFSYSILGISMISVGLWLIHWRYRIRIFSISLFWLFFFNFIIFVSLAVANSRSGLLGIISGILVIMLLGKFKQKKTLYPNIVDSNLSNSNHHKRIIQFRALTMHTVVLILIISLITYIAMVRETAISHDARIFSTYRSYIPIILTNPMGLPGGASTIETLEEAGSSFGVLLERTGGKMIAPHNLFLTTGVAYGPFAAIALFLLYASALHMGKKAFIASRNSGNVMEASWILLMLSVNIAIIAHSWFHNASIAMGEMRNWFWFGFLLSSVKFQNNKNRSG